MLIGLAKNNGINMLLDKRYLKMFILVIASIIAAVLYYLSPRFFTTDDKSVNSESFTLVDAALPNTVTTDLYSIFSSANAEYYWNNWDYEKNLIQLTAVKKGVDGATLTVKVDLPKEIAISEKYIPTQITCEKENTYLLSRVNSLQNIIEQNFNLMDKVESGQTLYSYCIDKECLTIGKVCILISKNN